jgi:hypothetical protein
MEKLQEKLSQRGEHVQKSNEKKLNKLNENIQKAESQLEDLHRNQKAGKAKALNEREIKNSIHYLV